MNIIYERCCGIDVHKKMIVACLLIGRKQDIRQFGTTTSDLKQLTAWLLENQCEMVAMESTASYWKPLYNLFELSGVAAMVVNAQHMKALPGRKTDVQDAAWIADLLKHGLLKASYIPEREQRELREISRYRKSLIDERSREYNRLQKMLEGANIKLTGYVSDISGKSSRKLIDHLIEDKTFTEEKFQELLHGSMHKNIPNLMKAMDGFLTPLQKQLLRSILDHIDDMTKRIEDLDKIMKDYLGQYEEAIKKLDEVPGIGTDSAQMILAEIGLDMNRFPSEAHISSWAGLSPGNNESAGKRKSGKTNKGNKTLKTILIQCAKSAAKNKDSFFYAQYQRIAVRRGKNRASVAVAHSLLISIYHMIKNNCPFKDLGANYYNQFNKESKINSLLKRLKALGHDTTANVSF